MVDLLRAFGYYPSRMRGEGPFEAAPDRRGGGLGGAPSRIYFDACLRGYGGFGRARGAGERVVVRVVGPESRRAAPFGRFRAEPGLRPRLGRLARRGLFLLSGLSPRAPLRTLLRPLRFSPLGRGGDTGIPRRVRGPGRNPAQEKP